MLVLVFLLALFVRVGVVVELSGNGPLQMGDARSYDEFALEIASGDWLARPVSSREPGFPILLAAVYRVFGHNYLAARLTNALLGALTCLLIFYLAERVFGYKVAVLATLWSIPYFHLVQYSVQVLREVLITFYLSTLILLFLVAIEKRSRAMLVSCCVVYLLLVHTDARYLLFSPFLTVFVFFMWKRPHRLRSAALFLTVFVIGMIPWQVRNYAAYDKIVLINTRTLVWSPPWKPAGGETAGILSQGVKRAELSARQATWLEETSSCFKEFYLVARFRDEVVAGTGEPRLAWSLAHNLASVLQYGVLIPFFAYGLFAIVRRKVKPAYLFVLVVAVQTGMHALKWGLPRFRVPIEPVLIIVAFYGLMCIIDAYRNKRLAATAFAHPGDESV